MKARARQEVLQDALAAAWYWDTSIKREKHAAWVEMLRLHADGLLQVMWYRPRWRDIWGDINYWVIFWWTVFGLFVITVLLQLFFRTEVGKKRKKELDQVWRDCVVRCCGPETCMGRLCKLRPSRIRVPTFRDLREQVRRR